ncbi:MAG TPA: tripartite tricarboxylate transporter substrate binding protein [Burkholderiales bacterium]|nr:tripartite tricarboxylate transporter substrate binding protein [Burkholderiales bacterium]
MLSAAGAYPERPIRIIVAFAPGGNIDLNARTVAPGLAAELGQPVVVENRAGAGSRIGTEYAAKAAADGYTMLLGASGSITINPVFGTNVAYDPVRDFAPTSTISLVPIALVVHPSLPARTAKEFIALAKARPGQLLMASAGAGSNTHLTGELFQVVAGVKFTHVPYKGGGPAVIDLVAGQTQLMFDQVTTSTPHVKAGKLRAIAVAFPKRSPVLPDVPTMVESGVNDFEAATVTGIFLPAATPKEIVNRVYTALIKVLDQPATRDAFTRLGAEVIKSTPEELGKRVRDDLARWKKVQQQTGIRID